MNIRTWGWAMAVTLGLGCARDEQAPAAESAGGDLQAPDAAAQQDAEPGVDAAPAADVAAVSYPAYPKHPEPPTILRDVALINDDVKFTNPFVPGHRTTMDGRVAIRVQGGPPGTETLRTAFSFSLFAPERLTSPIMSGPPGPEILAEPESVDWVFPPALLPETKRLGHHAICDPTQEFAAEGERPNPYPCGPDSRHDCYDLTVISSTSDDVNAQLWGTPVTVEVEHPKTAQARIVKVQGGEPVRGAVIPSCTEWTEPAVSQDGRLLTGRLGRLPREWTNPVTGKSLYRFYDLAYAVLPTGAKPCDVTGWTQFHPMSHAPYDPAMVGTYGLAAYPFRDSEGTLIPDGEDVGGTYPWVDREGTNVFMAGVQGQIAEQSTTRYPRRCVTPGCESFEESNDWDRGFLVAGLWTHGRLVHLDGMINSLDWTVGVTPAAHFLVDLYRDAAGEPVPVRFGAGRFIDAVRSQGGPYPAGYTHNANILDSLQNLLTFNPNTTPVTPRDVVWLMSTGVATDEIAFDDLLDPNALIVSNMQASITQDIHAVFGHTSLPIHHNGQVRKNTLGLPFPQSNVLDPDADAPIHLQNGATSLAWNVPPFGLVDAGEARVEPAALGGVRGRGFWLSGATEVRYEIAAQPQDVAARSWTVGLFLDPRARPGELRRLLTFPDGTALFADGHRQVQYRWGAEVVREVTLPAPDSKGWLHLGLLLAPGNQTVTLLHDGFALDRFQSERPLFQMVPGVFRVGERGPEAAGWRGWIDDLVVLAHDVSPEVACNHALGTLVRVEANEAWASHGARYPVWAHAEVATAAGQPEGGVYACYHSFSADYAAHLANIPGGTQPVRERIIFPEGPLKAGVPRPDSSKNAFCLTCHHADGRGGLSLEALVLKPGVLAEHDRRRQPMQPPRRVFGNIPAGWIPPGHGPGSPKEATVAPPEGALIDRWVLETAAAPP